MPVKKSELYSSIWKSCDELRGGMDASQYKDYILVLLFIKYISDKYSNIPYSPITIPKGASFKDLAALKGKPTIGDDINKKIIAPIAEANKLTGTIDVADFNDSEKLGKGKDMVDRLTNLVLIFENQALDFSKNKAEGDDLLGDAYEYLMKNFATQSGKSKGQFYTPAEVSRIMAKVIGINTSKITAETTVYDPTCGSGSLLLKVADEADTNISLYGQEMDVSTAALARMNMVLHNHASDVQTIARENTLSDPQFTDGDTKLKTFDYAVANPPFSYKSWTTGLTNDKGSVNDKFDRFTGFGIPPNKNGDYAFLIHLIRSLKSKGKGAIILPHGVLFRGGAESEIRQNIIRRGYIKGIIGLPANLFFGTGIPACIIVIDKENADNRKGIFMIDGSKGYLKDGNKNRLRHQDIHKIVDVFNKQIEISKYSRNVSFDEIEKNEYNLNIPRYIDSQEPEDLQDIEAHLKGGIPKYDVDALEKYWNVYPLLRKELFKNNARPGYLEIKIGQSDLPAEQAGIKNKIYNHPEFVDYAKKVDKAFKEWKNKIYPELTNIKVGTKPKKLIYTISEEILQSFSNLILIDKYDVYQHLMTYWTDTMQDDVYIIANDDWKADFYYDTEKKEYVCDLVPKELMIDRYFLKEKEMIEQLEIDRDNVSAQMEEMAEEHSGEDGLLEEVKTDSGKITKTLIKKRLKEISDAVKQYKKVAEPKISYSEDDKEEVEVLNKYLELIEKESDIKKQIKEVEVELLEKLKKKYAELTEVEVKNLVIDDKWLTKIYNDVKSELDRISQQLTNRIKELAERYNKTLPNLDENVKSLESKVNLHLKKMGFEWK
ncbi:MAG: type I restriction-modification system subunit M [Ignavibacteriota bacterium]|jgi:type I restriction enzyme M protein|nr:MAG: type I restriction-modification system subunit M [Chlorobiota bacterium]MBE7477203.1 type I restriction-modification system subunit M [Ignavibacteriales bacterium]MBL1122587.1 type I restriction-modification system subunit M [Ignavibacteriota bacterium]MCZ7616189.1 type I restriction-modification system subunit M [Ignavibacteriaceae bacterium]OQY75589.1 MAG: type I restriction-modification system subunit M [Ignavibacteriales bacterium UTCHB2]